MVAPATYLLHTVPVQVVGKRDGRLTYDSAVLHSNARTVTIDSGFIVLAKRKLGQRQLDSSLRFGSAEVRNQRSVFMA